jgi:hypothetical protein
MFASCSITTLHGAGSHLKAAVLILALAFFAPEHATTQSPRHASIAPDRLRVASLTNPIGLDSERPDFSWVLVSHEPSARNLSQSAYQILVASSAAVLAADHADIWDSGRVSSNQFLQVAYAGPALKSETSYFWKLRVWDRAGAASAWSKPASWTTALLHPDDWSAKWIAATPDTPPQTHSPGDDDQRLDSVDPMPIFRHAFDVDRPVKQALVFVTGLGQYELDLNGENVTNSVLNPGWTDYRKTVLYQTYDLTGTLRPGRNSFAILLGRGMYDVPGVKGRYTKFVASMGQPKLILQLHVLYADGSTKTVVSDRSWKTAPGPIVFSSTYGGEDYDARRVPSEWKSSTFDDASWSNALEVSGPGGLATPAAGLSGHIIPAMKVAKTYHPIHVTEPLPNTHVYDLGQNFSGWPVITVQGHAGDAVKMIPGELLDAQGLVTQASAAAAPDNAVTFTYTLKGGGPETWHPRFTYYGFRYVQVETHSSVSSPGDKPRLISVAGDFIHDDVQTTGEFSASLPLFNQIHRLIDNAILDNLASVLTDCPTREKLGWLEQTHLMGPSIMDNYDVAKLYEKLAGDIADAQLPSGMVPSIAPEFVQFVDDSGHDTSFRDSPEWGSSVILSPWAAYQAYGDKTALAEHYAAMTAYVAYLERKSSKHILQYGLGDWYDIGPKEPGESQLTSKGLTATGIFYQDLQTLSRIAAALGKDQDAQRYSEEAQAVKEAFNQRFFDSATNQYDRGSQTANAMPLALDLVPEDRRAAVLAHLIEDIHQHGNHLTAGDIGFHYVVQALMDGQQGQVLFDILSRSDSPSYGYQLAKGATALTEAWDANPKSSQDHFMLGHAEDWFYRGLAGIDLDLSRPAARQIIIRPDMLQQAGGASATIESVLGTIRSSWVYGKTWSLDVEIPAGADATVYLPAASRNLTESSKPLAQLESIHPPVEEHGTTILVLGSGTYHFQETLP